MDQEHNLTGSSTRFQSLHYQEPGSHQKSFPGKDLPPSSCCWWYSVPCRILDWELQFLSGYQQGGSSVSCHVDLPNMAACFLKTIATKSKGTAMVLNNVIAKCCSINFAIFHWFEISHRSSLIKQGCGDKKVGITKGTFINRMCSSQPQKVFCLFYSIFWWRWKSNIFWHW